jgi:hypothetical protein
MVRVPPMRGGSGGLVARLIRALASKGARVLDATGTSTEDKKRFLGMDGKITVPETTLGPKVI